MTWTPLKTIFLAIILLMVGYGVGYYIFGPIKRG
jgi:hypothetical protein